MCPTHLPDAMAIVAEEQDRASAERNAFARFVERVAELDPQSSDQRTQVSGLASPATTRSKRTPCREVYEIYRETVMATPHYEEDYGEPVAVHLRTELGDEIATALTANRSTTPQLKRALLRAGKRERNKRDTLEHDLETEYRELETAEERLQPIEEELTKRQGLSSRNRSFDELQQCADRLSEYDRRLDRFVQQRQQNLRTVSRKRRADETYVLQAYLYDGLAVQYPILAALTTATADVRHAKQKVEEQLQELIMDPGH